MTIRDIIVRYSKELEEISSTPRLDVETLLQKVLNVDRLYILLNLDKSLNEEEENLFNKFIEERLNNRPIAYIVGNREFMGLDFYVQEGVLIPRPDTEVLVGEVIKVTRNGDNILDMCTGSGCIGITLAKKFPESRVLGVDVSEKALKVAQKNKHNLEADNIDFMLSDLFGELGNDITFNTIVSNPPYIRSDEIPHLMPEVSVFEPHEALDGSEDGLLFYRRIIKDCRANLKPQGRLLFEIGCDQGRQVSQMMQFAGFSDVHVIKDLAGNDRVVSGVYDSKEEKHV